MENPILEESTFRHSGARGDIVYSLPTILALGGGKLLLVRDSDAFIGRPLSEQELGWMKDLLVGQCGISDVLEYDNRTVKYDLDNFRKANDLVVEHLAKCHLKYFGVESDLSCQWLKGFSPKTVGKIVVNRSSRYVGPFRWQELRGWEKDSVFIGFPEEYNDFKEKTGLDIPLYVPTSYVDICQVLLGSSLFIGNQSFIFSLAEALKVNRAQEVCLLCPNSLPQSDNGYVSLDQNILRYYVRAEGRKPKGIREAHSILQIRNKFSGNSLPKQKNIYNPILNRKQCSIVLIVENDFERDRLTACLSNMPSKEIFCVYRDSSVNELNTVLMNTSSDLIVLIEDRVSLAGSWLKEMACLIENNVGIVGCHVGNDSPMQLSGGVVAFPRKIILDCGGFTSLSDRMWIEFCQKIKSYGYSFRQCRSSNVKLKGC
jgi:hypothetical protein